MMYLLTQPLLSRLANLGIQNHVFVPTKSIVFVRQPFVLQVLTRCCIVFGVY